MGVIGMPPEADDAEALAGIGMLGIGGGKVVSRGGGNVIATCGKT
jgi:hypothetical protein